MIHLRIKEALQEGRLKLVREPHHMLGEGRLMCGRCVRSVRIDINTRESLNFGFSKPTDIVYCEHCRDLICSASSSDPPIPRAWHNIPDVVNTKTDYTPYERVVDAMHSEKL